ncbi:WXG100-like domain-containing protein [Actinomadura opuntiae]|uniref:WXG100-like domain-containing protein n=1 Tax=Actinomadura sp. OS1-43 TaxID=604315 RepID=UPI00255AB2E5|nr:hypothetical protein [Actinomadura sp. OS1-43]MDL4820787.1 hypothetical protein [Actinomadura sp. OS1-43]
MSKVLIDTALVQEAAGRVAASQNGIGVVWENLGGALATTHGMAGNPGKDRAAARFVAAYKPAVEAAWRGFAALHRSVGDMSRGLTQTARNHIKADRSSVINGRFSMVPQQQGSFLDQMLHGKVSGPLNVAPPPPAAGPGKSPPKSLLESLTGISFDPFDISEFWPTADPFALEVAARAWQTAHNTLSGAQGPLAAEVEKVAGHSDAPDIAAFGDYWKRLDGRPASLLEALPQLCAGMARACDKYAGAVQAAQVQLNDAAPNPVAALVETATIRAAMAAAAGRLLQSVSVIATGALAEHLVTSVTTGAANAPNLRILEAETEHPNGVYEPSGKHKPTNTRARRGGENSKEPEDGQSALDDSVQVKDTSPRRVGYDEESGEIVVLDQTSDGVFHGHVRSWEGLDQAMRNALVKSGMFNRRGKYIGRQ